MESCQRLLQSADIEEGVAIQSLCAIALLEGCSLRQLFTQFLVARKVRGAMGRRREGRKMLTEGKVNSEGFERLPGKEV